MARSGIACLRTVNGSMNYDYTLTSLLECCGVLPITLRRALCYTMIRVKRFHIVADSVI